MYTNITQSSISKRVTDVFNKMKQDNVALSAEDSARKLNLLIKLDKYDNGQEIDYFDVDDEGKIIKVDNNLPDTV